MGACQKVFCVRVGFWVRVIFTLEVTVYAARGWSAHVRHPRRARMRMHAWRGAVYHQAGVACSIRARAQGPSVGNCRCAMILVARLAARQAGAHGTKVPSNILQCRPASCLRCHDASHADCHACVHGRSSKRTQIADTYARPPIHCTVDTRAYLSICGARVHACHAVV